MNELVKITDHTILALPDAIKVIRRRDQLIHEILNGNPKAERETRVLLYGNSER